MPRKEQVEVIDGLRLTVRPIPPMENFESGARAGAIIAPLVGGASMNLLMADAIADAQVDVTQLSAVLLSLSREARWLVETYLDDATLDGVPFRAAMNEKISRSSTLPRCLWVALKVNYADFFEGLQQRIDDLISKLKAWQTPSEGSPIVSIAPGLSGAS